MVLEEKISHNLVPTQAEEVQRWGRLCSDGSKEFSDQMLEKLVLMAVTEGVQLLVIF